MIAAPHEFLQEEMMFKKHLVHISIARDRFRYAASHP